jgi:hypothetical protein
VTVDIGALMTVARPDTTAGLPVRDLIIQVLQMASGEILPILKEALVKVTLGQCPLTTWVFVANITDKFILRLDILHANHASVDLGCHVLCQDVRIV